MLNFFIRSIFILKINNLLIVLLFLFRLKVYIKIFVVMGVPLIVEVITCIALSTDKNRSNYYWIAVEYINNLRGLLVFVIFVVNKKVITELNQRFFHCYSFVNQRFVGPVDLSLQ